MTRRTGAVDQEVKLTVAVHVLEKPGDVDIHVGAGIARGVRGELKMVC